MKFKYPLNTELSKGFVSAKEYLVDADNLNKVGFSFIGDEYICFSISRAVEGRDIKASTGGVLKKIVSSRLGLRPDSAFYHDVESYLHDVVGVSPKLLSRTHVQPFRHRWLDSLIKEFNKSGVYKG